MGAKKNARFTTTRVTSTLAIAWPAWDATLIALNTDALEQNLHIMVAGGFCLIGLPALGLFMCMAVLFELWHKRPQGFQQTALLELAGFGLVVAAPLASAVVFALLWPSIGWHASIAYAIPFIGMPVGGSLMALSKRKRDELTVAFTRGGGGKSRALAAA